MVVRPVRVASLYSCPELRSPLPPTKAGAGRLSPHRPLRRVPGAVPSCLSGWRCPCVAIVVPRTWRGVGRGAAGRGSRPVVTVTGG